MSEWSSRFQDLEDYERDALSYNWKDLYLSIQETDRDWAKMEHLRDEIEVDDKEGFSTAYHVFTEVYEPPVSGSALGIHLLETDEEGNYTGLDEFCNALRLGTPTEERETDTDNILEHYE